MTSPRVGIVGARRARQGLGPFVARSLKSAGADVVAVVGTSADSAQAAREQLAQHYGITARAYADGAEMLERERLDALAVLSPAGTHRAWLEFALDAGLHVLCEKPFVWDGDDDLAAARRLVAGFARRRLHLVENCQWPFTLPAFHQLHPQLEGRMPQRFEMRLSPSVRGSAMIGDSLPHPISLLQALAPATHVRLEQVRFSSRSEEAETLTLDFRYLADEAPVEVRVQLVQSPSQPREAGWAVDGHWAHRLIRTSDYAMFFASHAQVVDVPDPLDYLVSSFVGRLAAGPPQDDTGDQGLEDRRIIQRMTALDALLRAWKEPA